jgi:L-ribulokinase
MAYAIGLDYGTNSVRCLIVDVTNGDEVGSNVYEYETGEAGIILDPADHNLARQNPADYVRGIEVTVKAAIAEAKKNVGSFEASQIIGIGVDTTGSTPIPVDADGTPLSMLDEFKDNPNACAWLWKDHTGHNIPSTSPNAAEPIPRNGFSARSCTACGWIRQSSKRLTPG